MQEREEYLSPTAFEQAGAFLRSEARPLEVVRFESIFYGSDISKVLRELAKFQNADGGFGHALEPDLRTPESSVLCTSIAFQIMRDHEVSRDHEMIRKAVVYLAGTLNQSELHWRIIPKSAETAAHAPWWKQEGREQEYRAFSLNPTAEILGIMIDYAEPDYVDEMWKRILDVLGSAKSIEMHDLICCLRLLETKNLSEEKRSELHQQLFRLISSSVSLDPEEWGGYCLRPLQVASSAGSPFLHGMEKAVSKNLDYELKSQQADGAWHPTWSWGDNYPDSWEFAKKEWSGILTLEKLKVLKSFGRIETEPR